MEIKQAPPLNTTVVTELKSLDRDLREIYTEFGTSAIQFQQHSLVGERDIYNECEEHYSEPFNLIGRVTLNTNPQTQSGAGQPKDNTVYVFQVVKSVLDEHGVDKITTRDRLIYLGVELDITQVVPVNILGDYALQYEITAMGNEYISPVPGV